MEGCDAFVVLQDVAECLQWIGAVKDQQLTRIDQLNLLTWVELSYQGVVYALLFLQLLSNFLHRFRALSRYSLPEFADRLCLVVGHNRHFFYGFIPC